MTIKQLQKVMDLNCNQCVKVSDARTQRTIYSVYGWIFEPEYDYDGTNVDEVERILSLKISSVVFDNDTLKIWAY